MFGCFSAIDPFFSGVSNSQSKLDFENLHETFCGSMNSLILKIAFFLPDIPLIYNASKIMAGSARCLSTVNDGFSTGEWSV